MYESEIHKQVENWQKYDPNLKYEVIDIEQIYIADDSVSNESFEKTSRFMVLYNDKFIILTFRGSSNFADWYKNIKIRLTQFNEGEGRVHLGFYQTVQNMQEEINGTINKIRDSNQAIYITGHSLGGAQALLSAFVCKPLSDFTSVTTFGQPRVGDEEFMEWVNPKINNRPPENKCRYFRMVNKGDPVTNVPYFFYFHVGSFYINCCKEKYYDIDHIFKGAQVQDVDYMPELGELINNEITDEELGWPFIENHSIDLYIKNADYNKNKDPFV